MVFTGQADIYKTKNLFKLYNEFGDEINRSTFGNTIGNNSALLSQKRALEFSPDK